MIEYSGIQSKLDAKIQAMKVQLSTQQKVLNDLFNSSNKDLERTQNHKDQYFTIEDLKILDIIKQERAVRETRTQNQNQYPQPNEILKCNVRNNYFPYKNLNDIPYNNNHNVNDIQNLNNCVNSNDNNNNLNVNKNSTNENYYQKELNKNKNIGFYSNKNMSQLEYEIKNKNKTNKNLISLNVSNRNSPFYENAEIFYWLLLIHYLFIIIIITQ